MPPNIRAQVLLAPLYLYKSTTGLIKVNARIGLLSEICEAKETTMKNIGSKILLKI